MSPRTAALCLGLTFLLIASAGAGDALLELEVGGHAYVGKSLGHNHDTCWLMGQDGRVQRIALDDVTSFRKVAESFRPVSPSAFRSSLREELGRDFEVSARSRFIVAAPDGQAESYAELLDRVQRSFVRYFSRRSLRLREPEVPLAAIVFADAAQFADYCRQDNVSYSPTLIGYYQPETNRIALYDSGSGLASGNRGEATGIGLPAPAGLPLWSDLEGTPYARISGNLRDTLVHEATHQLAFNMGLHTRVGENPRWVVEGLALLFEQQVPASSGGSPSSEVNDERLYWFQTRLRPDWEPGMLREFVASDRPFATSTLNSYSLAWALAYYLSDRRSADFAVYLEAIRERDAWRSYSSEERLNDFQRAFGDDIDWLEVQLLRYVDALES